ncbi:MAG: hypothetical protein J6Z17_05185 [Treponema sp.]|nr:hypothetical protein [Treponema sp.]
MNRRWIITAVSAAVCLTVVFVLLYFRSPLSLKIWNNYNLVYVSESVSESDVLSVFESEGCTGVISRLSQKKPFSSPITPVFESACSSYLKDRLLFFSDKSGTYNVFYIPSSQTSRTQRAVKKISNNLTEKCGMDSSSGFPFLSFSVALIFFIVLTVLSANKTVFAFPSSFMLLLSFSVPFFSVASGACLFMLVFYVTQRLWQRGGSLSKIVKTPSVIVFSVCALSAFFSSSFRESLLAFTAALGSTAAYFLLNRIYLFMESKSSFTFVPIFSSRQISMCTKSNLHGMLFSSAASLILVLLFICFSDSGVPSFSDNILLPSPKNTQKVSAGTQQLPGMKDFYIWAWDTLTFPYRDLNAFYYGSAPSEGDSVYVPRYTEEGGVIKMYEETVLTFNDSFFEAQNKIIMDSANEPVEKLLLSQESSEFLYTKKHGSAESGRFASSLFLLFLSAAAPLGVWGYYKLSGSSK